MTTTRTTGDCLLADILANPADDDLRLIYADYLDDHGDSDRAVFIRTQIELARLEVDGMLECQKTGSRNPHGTWIPHCRCKVCRLVRLEYKVSCRHIFQEWMPVIPCTKGDWRRGFVSRIRCHYATWLGCGSKLVKQHSVEYVGLGGLDVSCTAVGVGVLFRYFNCNHSCFPFVPTQAFGTLEELQDYMSRLALEWARKQP